VRCGVGLGFVAFFLSSRSSLLLYLFFPAFLCFSVLILALISSFYDINFPTLQLLFVALTQKKNK
jgi:hypothetical protein